MTTGLNIYSSPRSTSANNCLLSQNALHFATSKANLSTVRTLITHKCSARVKDRRGQLPLHRAAAVGSIPILKILLEEGKSPVNATDVDGFTALHHAISEGHGDAAIQLLKAGAEPEKRDGDGRLAMDLTPDPKVKGFHVHCKMTFRSVQANRNAKYTGSEIHLTNSRTRRHRAPIKQSERRPETW
jgi:hypothetical protein